MVASIPPQAWLALIGAAVAAPSAAYVIRYLGHGSSPPDITQPPQDLSWRSGRRFLASAAIVLATGGAFAYSLTPTAERWAQSSLALSTLLAGAGSVILKIAFDGFRTRKAAALAVGVGVEFARDDAPARYWSVMAWNCALGASLLLVSPQTWYQAREQACYAPENGGDAQAGIDACNFALANHATSPSQRAVALSSRGQWHLQMGAKKAALADFDRSIEADNTKAEAFYRRGSLYETLGQPLLAKENYTSALLLDPGNADAAFARGILKINDQDPFGAVEDLTIADKARPGDAWILANRGLANAWLGKEAEAERDLRAAERLDPGNSQVKRGRVAISLRRRNIADAKARLTAILDTNPDDEWARDTLAGLETARGKAPVSGEAAPD